MNKLKKILEKFKDTGFFDIFGSSVIVKVIGFLSAIILTRVVTKEEYGVFTAAWNVYSIIMLMTGFGSCYAVLQLACENFRSPDKQKNIYKYGFNYGIKANVIICIIVFASSLVYPSQSSKIKMSLAILSILPLIQYIVEFQSTYFRTERNNRLFSISNIVNVALVLISSIAGALWLKEIGFILGRYIAYIILALMGVLLWKVPVQFAGGTLEEHEKKVFRKIATISMITAGISQLLYLIDVFVLGLVIADEGILASYKVATIIPSALSFIPSALVTYIYPYFAEKKDDVKWCKKRYLQLTSVIMCVNFIISYVLYVMAPFIITTMYGKQYIDAVEVFRILMISYFFSGSFRTIAGNLLITQRKIGFNTFVSLLSGVLNVFADVYFISRWGSVGAAYATLCIVILCSVLNSGYFIHTLNKVKR